MAEVVRQTTTTQSTGSTPSNRSSAPNTLAYLIYFLFGILEILLVFRLVFKLAGANPSSTFASMVYSISKPFILPFEGIFRRGYTQGVETTSILEPSALVAIVVYAIIAWGFVKLIAILSGHPHDTA